MLQTSAISRPSTEEIMKHKMIMEKIDEYNLLSKLESNAHRSDLLGTIQLPKNLRVLSTRLPKSKYQARYAFNIYIYIYIELMKNHTTTEVRL